MLEEENSKRHFIFQNTDIEELSDFLERPPVQFWDLRGSLNQTILVNMDVFYILNKANSDDENINYLATAEVLDCVAIAFFSAKARVIALGHFSKKTRPSHTFFRR